jgi:hypothetical protein
MAAEFKVDVTADGSLRIDTDNMAGPHHGSADELVEMLNKLAGGATDKKSKKKGLKHKHSHGQHQHVHADGTKHTH